MPLWRGTSFSGLAVAQSNAIYMNHGNVGMGGGMWLWIVISVLAVALLLVVINKLTKK
ncbi:MAG: hypothetical protein KJT03_10555 [Verrucomicrobiae bacterium]|nr:hypothetical protein [Verrucomicrobiae bacterium]